MIGRQQKKSRRKKVKSDEMVEIVNICKRIEGKGCWMMVKRRKIELDNIKKI